MPTRLSAAVRAVALAGVIAMVVGCIPFPASKSRQRFAYNASGSAPLGLYWIDFVAPNRGDLVVVRPSVELSRLMAERDILPCNTLLLKTVAAFAGDKV